MTQILIQNPELKIQSNDDGVWLCFKTQTGKHAAINLPVAYNNEKSIVDSCIFEWAKEFATKTKQATLQDLIEDLESENKEPRRLIPMQLHDGLRHLQNIYVYGKYGSEDRDGIGFLKQYMNERQKEL